MGTPSSTKNGDCKKKGVGVVVTETGRVVCAVAEPAWAVKLRLKLLTARPEAALKVTLAEAPEIWSGKAASVLSPAGSPLTLMLVAPGAPNVLSVTVTALFGTMFKGAGETKRVNGVAPVPPPPPLVEPPPPHEVNEAQVRTVMISNASACSGTRQALRLKGQQRKVRVMRKKFSYSDLGVRFYFGMLR